MDLLSADRTLGSARPIDLQEWGSIQYAEALQRQLDLVELVRSGKTQETLVVCTHPPVVTLGRSTREGDLCGWQGNVVEVNRGGRATYHGPSQIVVYPILDLGRLDRDLHKYMRRLEDAIVATLTKFGVPSHGRSMQTQFGDTAPVEATGVWIGSRKIASIGIGVRNWVSFHGLALNVERDPEAFKGLLPCGFTTETMISIEEILGRPVDRSAVQSALVGNLRSLLQRN